MLTKSFLRIFITLLLISSSLPLHAETILPGLYGDDLLEALVDNYKPSSVLSYGDARDVLYGEIYNENNYLTCVYTGYSIYMSPSADPSSWAYDHGINCEHTWPQSKGAVGNAKSDMHHLYPTRIDVNGARGSDPFAESNDNQTDDWYRLDDIIHYVPTQNIDEYSEDNNNSMIFEPREDHKGNAARSCFYFYTMYKDQADDADPNFFNIQKNYLFEWHELDPADELEIERTEEMGEYQQDKPNPFVLDPTLVARAYFPWTISIDDENFSSVPQKVKLDQNHPNPFNPETIINFDLPKQCHVTLQIYDISGKLIKTLIHAEKTGGYHSIAWDGRDNENQNVGSGMYLYELRTKEERQIKQMLLLK